MPKTKATFIEPMLLLGTEKLPQGADWSYEIKLDGYRVLGHQERWQGATALAQR